MQSRTSVDLQQNVYQNRSQFIKISKEAEKLKGEMRLLGNLMSELKSNTTALRTAVILPSTLRDKRSSVADRTALWNSQLQALWKSVEGSQKFLPAAPGRHVVQNAGHWVELDNATWKSRRSMQIFLLNDHILVASRKKRKVGGSTEAPSSKLVADRCWALLDVELVDLAGTSGKNKVADAVMIRGQESFTYRTEKAEDQEKAKLLLNFRKAVDELRRGQRSETRDVESISDNDRLIEVDGKQQNLRWVESQVDELDIDIALQRFEEAVSKVEELTALAKGLKNNQIARDFINVKAAERAFRLAEFIARELIDAHNESKKARRNVSWLARLGFEDRAREAYLEARSQVIQRRSR